MNEKPQIQSLTGDCILVVRGLLDQAAAEVITGNAAEWRKVLYQALRLLEEAGETAIEFETLLQTAERFETALADADQIASDVRHKLHNRGANARAGAAACLEQQVVRLRTLQLLAKHQVSTD